MRLYECGVRFDKMLENGAVKKVTETYLVDAITFSEAEARIIREITPYMSGEFDVISIKRTKYTEIVYDKFNLASSADAEVQKMMGCNSQASNLADKWFKVKINFITIDEKTAAEKKTSVYYIVNAGSNKAAHETTVDFMKGTIADYEIASVVETNIMDVYVYSADGSKSVGVKEANMSSAMPLCSAKNQTPEAIFDQWAEHTKIKTGAKSVKPLPDGNGIEIDMGDKPGSDNDTLTPRDDG